MIIAFVAPSPLSVWLDANHDSRSTLDVMPFLLMRHSGFTARGDALFRRFILDIQIEPTPDGLRCRINLSLTCVAHAALYNGGPSSSSTPTPFPTAKHN